MCASAFRLNCLLLPQSQDLTPVVFHPPLELVDREVLHVAFAF